MTFSFGSIFSENKYCGVEIAPIFGSYGFSNIQYGHLFKNDIMLIGGAGVFYNEASKPLTLNDSIELGTFYNNFYCALFVSNHYYGIKIGLKL